MSDVSIKKTVRCAVVHPYLKKTETDYRARLGEALGLARAIDLEIVYSDLIPLSDIKPKSYVGEGVIDTLCDVVRTHDLGLVIVDTALSPVQQRNLERALNCKVIDRTGLILDIFGRRAQTAEGRLQVELAALTYQKSRLVRSWTHLERQRGGMGFLGGPGETQLEMDRRIIGDRIKRIKVDLENVVKTRHLHRMARRRVPYPVVALVGYTNAGKSTLFNRLTGASVRAEDLLFATLDPTMRALILPSGRSAILSDTVGFISDLPTHLIAAFRATLEEVMSADIIVHVQDISHPFWARQKADVLAVLTDLGVDHGRVMDVYNKIDQVPKDGLASMVLDGGVALSALTGDGTPLLLAAIEERLTRNHDVVELTIPFDGGAPLSWVYDRGVIIARETCDDGVKLTARLSAENRSRFSTLFPHIRLRTLEK